LGPEDTALALIRRLDAGYDSAANRQMLAGLPGYAVLKGASSALARRLAQRVAVQAWLPVADDVQGAAVTPEETGLRRLVYELHQADGTVDYALLYTTLPAGDWGLGRLFAFCGRLAASRQPHPGLSVPSASCRSCSRSASWTAFP
jgi:hypothetical protein